MEHLQKSIQITTLSSANKEKLKLQNQLNGLLEEFEEAHIFCSNHKSTICNNMCINQKCKQRSLFCQECVVSNSRIHDEQCTSLIFPIEQAIQQLSKSAQLICPDSQEYRQREYFQHIIQEDKQNIQQFEQFVQEQKVKIKKDIDIIYECVSKYFCQIREEIQRKLDCQIQTYKENYEEFMRLVDNKYQIGSFYQQLRELGNYQTIIHKLNKMTSDEAVIFADSAKELLYKYSHDTNIQMQVNKISDIYYLLLQQTMNPPTYQSGNFRDFSLSSLKLQVELLSKKAIESIEFHLANSPLEKLFIQQTSNSLLVDQEEDTLFGESIRQKKTYQSQQKSQLYSRSNSLVTSSPANHALVFMQKQNQYIRSFSQCLQMASSLIQYSKDVEKSNMTFSNDRKNCIVHQKSDKNFFIERGLSQWIKLENNNNVCVTSIIVIYDDLIAYALSNNIICLYCVTKSKILQQIECKSWIYALEKVKIQLTQQPLDDIFSNSVMEKIINDPQITMKQCGFLLAATCDDSIQIWNTNFAYQEGESKQRLYPLKELKKDDYFRGLSLLDLEDGQHLCCGDWDGRIFIWNYANENLIFKLETKCSMVHRLALLKPKDLFVSASRNDYELGGISLWKMKYAKKENENEETLIECTLYKRLQQASCVNAMVLLMQNSNYLVSSEKNQIQLYDINEAKVIRTIHRGESCANDIVVIENGSVSTSYFLTILINSSVVKIIDSNEIVLAQYTLDEFNCMQCHTYFTSTKMAFLNSEEGLVKVIFVRHKHYCPHHDESNQHENNCLMKSSICIQGISIKIAKFN